MSYSFNLFQRFSFSYWIIHNFQHTRVQIQPLDVFQVPKESKIKNEQALSITTRRWHDYIAKYVFFKIMKMIMFISVI